MVTQAQCKSAVQRPPGYEVGMISCSPRSCRWPAAWRARLLGLCRAGDAGCSRCNTLWGTLLLLGACSRCSAMPCSLMLGAVQVPQKLCWA